MLGMLASLALITSGCSASGNANPTADVNAADSGAVQSVAKLVPQAVKDKGSLSIAMSIGMAPTKYVDPKDGKTMLGSDPELASALAKVMGLKAIIYGVAFAQIIPGLESGKYDMAVSQFGINKERLDVLDFVEYQNSTASLEVLRGNPKGLNFDALCGLKIGGSNGSMQMTDYLPKLSAKCKAAGKNAIVGQVFIDQQGALLAMKSGRIDGVFGDKPVMLYAAAKDPDMQYVSDYVVPEPSGIAMPNGSKLLPAVQAALKETIRSGEYQKIYKKWGMTAMEITEPKVRTTK